MPKIKICGLRRGIDVSYANELRPEYIGFVFAKQSRRFIPWERAAELRKALSPDICPVGVFVNTKPEHVAELLNTGVIEMAQLHGQEDEQFIQRLRKLTEKPIIQAFSITGAADIPLAVHSAADYILLDHGPGGTGEHFDWSLIKGVSRDFFLAGGLSADNVAQAIQKTAPYAVDVSSGVEAEGFKDFEKMHSFIQAVKEREHGIYSEKRHP